MLWGRSGNICAFPECKKELVMNISETDDASVIGEVAHIVAKEHGGPRGDSLLTSEQRDKYDNLILMCSIHHKIIDDHPAKYPVQTLVEYKKNHENWVKQNLKLDNKKQREDEIYATYIDYFIRLANIENWRGWTSFLFGGDRPSITTEQHNGLTELIQYITTRVWSERYPDLEKSLINFKNILNDLINVFDKYIDKKLSDKVIWTKKFYRIDEQDTELYNKLHDKYMYHIKLVQDLTLELTRAANYIFDKVRDDLFSSFRINEGVLLVEVGPFADLSWRMYRVEYKDNERIEMPYPGLREFMEIRSTRDLAYGEGISEDYFLHIFL